MQQGGLDRCFRPPSFLIPTVILEDSPASGEFTRFRRGSSRFQGPQDYGTVTCRISNRLKHDLHGTIEWSSGGKGKGHPDSRSHKIGLIDSVMNYERRNRVMEHVYKFTELTGSSKTSMEDAVRNAITKASKTLPNMRWFQVVETRGYIEAGNVSYWQVTIKIGSTLEN